jgi:hypothetical protein
LDSGASANFVSGRIFQAEEVARQQLELASREATVETSGRIVATLHIGEACYEDVPFLVVNELRDEVILGHQWLRNARATMDFTLGCVHHGARTRRTTYWNQRQPEASGTCRIEDEVRHEFPSSCAREFLDVLREFAGVMNDESVTGTVSAVSHTIRLVKNEPFRIRPYHLSEDKKRALFECVRDMLASGVIERSDSEYCSPVVLVRKKDGTVRFCTDYRRLNQNTKDEAAPLPRIQEVLRDFGTAQVYSSMDLKSGYWQIPMEPASKHLTAFATPDGATYQYRVMPFGLKNAPATFQKLMTRVLAGLLGKCVHVYLDDIIVYSRTHEEHVSHLRQVFERLHEYGLRCAVGKCRFGVSELPYLGHVIGSRCNRPQEGHLRQIRDAPTPRTKRQLQSFLGLANWVREYVPRFAEIAAPLTDLLHKGKSFKWTTAAGEAFLSLKEAMDQPLVLHRPDPDMSFTLQTDASGVGIAAVLFQDHADQRRIVSYASARLNETQRRYHVNEQECLAIVWAVKRYRPYLEEKPFVLKTDNKALLWLNTTKESNAKLTRWALLLQEFSFRVEHVPGKENELPDLLSRQPSDDNVCEEAEEDDRMLVPMRDSQHREVLNAIDVPTLADEVKAAQHADQDFPGIVARLQRILAEGPREPGERSFAENYLLEDGNLVKQAGQRRLLWVPEAARPRILHEFHDSLEAGHPGQDETYRALTRFYTWPTAQQDTRNHVRSCLICATTKRGPVQAAAPLRAHTPQQPWQTIAIDFMGPYEVTPEGKRYLLVVTDLFSRWVEAFPVAAATARVTTTILEKEVFSRWGYPRDIISDNGSQFSSNTFKRACHRWQVRHWPTANYHPRANPTERRNQEVKKILRIAHQTFPNQPWDRHLAKGLFNLRRRQNAATGQTPSHLLLGFDLRAPGEWEWDRGPIPDTAEERHQRARSHQRRYQERYVRPGPPTKTFQAGDRVLVRHHARRGFEPKWIGPVRVIANARGDCYWVERGAYATREHIDHLRPAPVQTPAEPEQDAPTREPHPDREDTPTVEPPPEEEDVAAGPTIVGQLLPDQPIPTQEELQRHRRRHLARQRVRENREFRPPPEPIWMANRSESEVEHSDSEPQGDTESEDDGGAFEPRLG